MTETLRILIKGNRWLYGPAVFFRNLLWGLRSIRIDMDSMREAYAELRGFTGLGRGNYKFYSNIFPRICAYRSTRPADVVVLDVGANDGWFAKVVFRFCGRDTKVISFEPLRSMSSALTVLGKKFPNYRFESLAVGAENGSIEITEYGTSGLSSIKGLDGAYQYSNHYKTNVVSKYPIEVITLDEYLSKNGITNDLVLKIDTQGFEKEVLAGAQKALASGQIKAVIVEVMTIEKYTGATLYDEIFATLHSYGFRIYDLYQAYYEQDGALSEIDCAFVRR